ncbi:DUF2798 domain-containing protein [Pseudomonas sp. gcc21]|uniref:DUF2798 domain-containing protein n=1 Tax=Pseudomonas sp. gcc21 TaxID=2726989 RepID=UPI00145209A8|nr:DUF2798 domain-containing protein [Pseudomonas sp. gcc21]QJD58367.1 DUF2798 domain-containing protein [Pseudomonas sp. gcc21]
MTSQHPSSRLQRFKLPLRFTPFVVAFYMSGIMAFLMCLVITAANAGIGEGYIGQVWQAYKLAMPSAFFCILAVRPLVIRLVECTVRSH